MRFLPAAVTPLSVFDVSASIIKHLVGNGLQTFERELADFFCASKAYTFSSLMRTNYACMIALAKDSDRKKIIMPRYSCPSFVHAVIAAGLEVQYCDIDYKTLGFDMQKLVDLDMSNTLAIICTNLFGLTSSVDEIVRIAHQNSVFVVEGVDYGVGTIYKNKRIGTFGDVAILNFQEGKAIPVGGGAIITSNRRVIKFFSKKRDAVLPNIITMIGFSVFSKPFGYALFMKFLAIFRIKNKQFSMEDTIRKTNSETDFEFDELGFDKSISNFQGALGCRILERLNFDINERQKNALALKSGLATISGISLVEEVVGVESVHYIRLPILVGNGKRDVLLDSLLKEGIEASPMYIEHGMSVDERIYPGAYKVANELLTLPCHPFVDGEDIKKIIAITKLVMN